MATKRVEVSKQRLMDKNSEGKKYLENETYDTIWHKQILIIKQTFKNHSIRKSFVQKLKKIPIPKGIPTSDEIQVARERWIKALQEKHFLQTLVVLDMVLNICFSCTGV